MKKITMPVCDVEPYDQFEVFQSTRTLSWLLYRYRIVKGQTPKAILLIATYGDRRTAMRDRNAMRTAAERLRTTHEYDERRRVWAGLEATA